MKSGALKRVAVVSMLCALVVTGVSLPAASASPAASATALAHLKSDWNKKSAQVRKGTCAEYHKWPSTTVVDATNKAWGVKANRKNMTIAEWLKVYKSFYKWAC